jgi:hypothetical protein
MGGNHWRSILTHDLAAGSITRVLKSVDSTGFIRVCKVLRCRYGKEQRSDIG